MSAPNPKPVMPLSHRDQAVVIDRLQRGMWSAMVERFQARQRDGLTQADLARRLGIARPQVHVWLSDPTKITLKAAARLMLAMEGELLVAPRDVEGPYGGS